MFSRRENCAACVAGLVREGNYIRDDPSGTVLVVIIALVGAAGESPVVTQFEVGYQESR